jgi:uncharacterized protein (TIGR02996 family)
VTATLDALLAAVIASPEDDTPRLVLADELDIRAGGSDPRAEFVRVQVGLAKSPAPKVIRADEAEVTAETDDDSWSFGGFIRRQPKVRRSRLTARVRGVPAVTGAVGEVVCVVVPHREFGEYRFAVLMSRWDRRYASTRTIGDEPTYEFMGEVVDEPPEWAEVFRLRDRERELWVNRGWAVLPAAVGMRFIAHIDQTLPADRDDDIPRALVRRGFIESVECSAADWVAHGDALTAAHPVTDVALTTVPADLIDGGHAEHLLSRRWPAVRAWHLPPPAGRVASVTREDITGDGFQRYRVMNFRPLIRPPSHIVRGTTD